MPFIASASSPRAWHGHAMACTFSAPMPQFMVDARNLEKPHPVHDARLQVMAQSASQLRLPLSPGLTTTVAVQVGREGSTWRVLLQPAVRLLNHLGTPIYCSITTPALPGPGTTEAAQGPLTGCGSGSSGALGGDSGGGSSGSGVGAPFWRQPSQLASPAAQPAPPQVHSMRLDAGSSADLALAHRWQQAAGGRGGAAVGGVATATAVRIWMGPGEGWSSEVSLDKLAARVQVRCSVPSAAQPS
jgi:hypothetical protein